MKGEYESEASKHFVKLMCQAKRIFRVRLENLENGESIFQSANFEQIEKVREFYSKYR